MEADDLAAAISSQVRVLRATRALSQRELAIGAGVPKSALGRIEAAELQSAVRTWLTVLDRLGVAVALERDPAAAAVVELDTYRDLAGRRFPAHRMVEPFRLTTYWWSRHAKHPLSAPSPPVRWSGRREPASDRLLSAEDRLLSAEDRLLSAEDRLLSAEDRLLSAEDRRPGEAPQPPRAAPTTSRASACTCARCSGPRNDSA